MQYRLDWQMVKMRTQPLDGDVLQTRLVRTNNTNTEPNP